VENGPHPRTTTRIATDHAALVRRVDRNASPDSLLLRKPTRTDPHKGGRVIEPAGWEHHLTATGRPVTLVRDGKVIPRLLG
jgi:hypothetical protein